MGRSNERPSRALFGEVSPPLPTRTVADSSRANFMMLQHNLRSRTSISRLELETVLDVIDRANLTLSELLALKDIARNKASDSQRSLGWHCGFEDLYGHLEDILSLQEAA